MVYRETLVKISEGKGITTNGSKLIFTGNRSFVPGDTVWTDGKYIWIGSSKRWWYVVGRTLLSIYKLIYGRFFIWAGN